ncbi:MAG: hypothetical protein AAFV19_23945 [Pseudomonadota bacterium]
MRKAIVAMFFVLAAFGAARAQPPAPPADLRAESVSHAAWMGRYARCHEAWGSLSSAAAVLRGGLHLLNAERPRGSLEALGLDDPVFSEASEDEIRAAFAEQLLLRLEIAHQDLDVELLTRTLATVDTYDPLFAMDGALHQDIAWLCQSVVDMLTVQRL